MANSMNNRATSPIVVRLKKPLERSIAHGHPWIFRDALAPHGAEPGDVVTVLDRRDRFLARGLADAGPIAVRVFTTRDEPVDVALMTARVEEALALRDRLAPPETDALRLIHGEGDRLPGLVCDRYGPYAVLRFDGQAIERWRSALLDALRRPLRARGVRTLLVRTGRGADKTVQAAWGRLPDDVVEVCERGMTLLADLVHGQKTGLFVDHRPSRYRVRQMARGLRVLNLYAYTGGFSIAAGLGGAARVVTVDVATPAIALAERTWVHNELDPGIHRAVAADVAAFLGGRDGETFDLVVADPPSFAPRESALKKALGAYRALHQAAIDAVSPGGWYLAASCSSHVDRAAFESTLRTAAHAARRPIQVVGRWGAGADHPVPLGFPEGEYLTVVLVRAF